MRTALSHEPMTDRQSAIVEFIVEFAARRGYPPSVREIGTAVGLSSTSSVHHHLCRLEELGMVIRVQNRSRAVVVPVASAA